MPTFRVVLLIVCLAATSIQAQSTVPMTPDPQGGEAMNLPRRHDLPEETAPPERSLTVFPTAAPRIVAQADTLGDHGNLYLDNATAPSTGIQLLAKTAYPDIFLKLGLSTSGASFNVTDAGDVSLFKVRGDGRAIFRKDQNAATIFEINNGTSGNASYGSLQFLEGTTGKGGLYAFSSGTVGAPGGANSLWLSNNVSAPLVFGTASTERMRINADGTATLNYAGVYPARLIIQHGTDNSSALFTTHQPLVEATATQNDNGIAIQTQENILTGAINYGSVMGINSWTHLSGTGLLNNLTGAQFQTGTTAAGTISYMFGLRVMSTLAAGSAVSNGFGVYVDDTQATDDYAFFQAAPNDTNYFAGNVIIGGSPSAAASPYALKVQGDMSVSGNITGAKVIGAVYQDLAEWVPASSDMTPGTVVVLNTARSNEVMPSSRRYDTAVAGVVSAAPGIILGVEGDSKEQVATTGRVKVRVDARTNPVHVGDLLVTSDVPGTAMRSEPMEIGGHSFHKPGTIIGKALEPLEGGLGEILVLLSMQ